TAQAEAKTALNGLFLGLGAVALLVGAVGVANIMVISGLERRSEIGLRRALVATKAHIRTQFLAHPILLALTPCAPAPRPRAAAPARAAPRPDARRWPRACAGGGGRGGLRPAPRTAPPPHARRPRAPARPPPPQPLWAL